MKREDPQHLTDPTVDRIAAYTFSSRPIEYDKCRAQDRAVYAKLCAQRGGFNPFTREFTPMRFASEGMELHEALDAITAAVEAGIVDRNSWACQLFAGEEELDGFLEELEYYDECYRIIDRWWYAIAELVGADDEEGLISSAEVANALRNSIADGEEKKAIALAEVQYRAANPSTPIRLTRAQHEAYYRAISDVRLKAHRVGATDDISCRFKVFQPYFELRDKVLYAHEATATDIARYMKKPAAKRKVGAKKTVAKKKSKKV
jgi:hypothetical protein